MLRKNKLIKGISLTLGKDSSKAKKSIFAIQVFYIIFWGFTIRTTLKTIPNAEAVGRDLSLSR
ncbi:MAG: hypothetical protein A3I05_09660 [Deltaproteobacteria bacterium RIFCSPLOWO2_02_FULL_44_10]|nr:MAG: hypothetical protein A3C46_06440 [Deltaproteobacteria bacterium RIFCSPHIGHO2_02_FULL_44_16]OGQ46464.1 MAG: hypothetical protein A3I05_09660 [Deltaproteobacteria bacterium RIFCSPLOWO2_02_FULL_44_10]